MGSPSEILRAFELAVENVVRPVERREPVEADPDDTGHGRKRSVPDADLAGGPRAARSGIAAGAGHRPLVDGTPYRRGESAAPPGGGVALPSAGASGLGSNQAPAIA